MLGLEIRPATCADIDAIAKITKEAFKKYAELAGIAGNSLSALTETAEDIKRDIQNKLVLVAFMDNIPVGSVRVEINADVKTAYLSRFGVKLGVQNNGIGKSLMSLVDLKMHELGIKKISLHTGSKVSNLMQFYYSRGFYVDSISTDAGYIRAFMCKEYN